MFPPINDLFIKISIVFGIYLSGVCGATDLSEE